MRRKTILQIQRIRSAKIKRSAFLHINPIFVRHISENPAGCKKPLRFIFALRKQFSIYYVPRRKTILQIVFNLKIQYVCTGIQHFCFGLRLNAVKGSAEACFTKQKFLIF